MSRIICRYCYNYFEPEIVVLCTVRRAQHSGYGIRNIDSKIKSLLKMKHQIWESRLQLHADVDVGGATDMLDLPDDCLHYIVSFLIAPRDVLNLGLTSM